MRTCRPLTAMEFARASAAVGCPRDETVDRLVDPDLYGLDPDVALEYAVFGKRQVDDHIAWEARRLDRAAVASERDLSRTLTEAAELGAFAELDASFAHAAVCAGLALRTQQPVERGALGLILMAAFLIPPLDVPPILDMVFADENQDADGEQAISNDRDE